ncbi:nuclease HARBI1 [Trichonephila clavipes]|nr:nuclease HARBI1 [Trichonephila clavipes]
MSSRHHIDDFMRGRIIGKIEEGRKITDVAREFDIAHSVVSRLWKSFKTTGMCSRRHGGGRVRSTTPAEDRYIVLSAKRNRRTTAQQVANQFLAASGKQISRKPVARRLRGGGLYVRRPVLFVPLTRQPRTARLQWCREHHNWTEQDWACVLFSDESRFSLSSDCRRQLIWRESGTAYRPENIQEKDRYPTCSIMVWAGIMINGRTRLHVVANGTMMGQRYIDEVSRKFFSIAGFPKVIGALDGTFIRIVSPGGEVAERFCCRKNYFALNVQTNVDADLVIRNVVARWPGSAHDSTVFNNSAASLSLKKNELYKDFHLLGDTGYACEKYLLTPFWNPRFLAEARDLELEVNEDDMEDELTIEEFKEILKEEHQETQRNVSPSEQEEDERGSMPTSAIEDLFRKWDAVRAMVL